MLRKAQKEGYAVCAFNVENMEMAQAAAWAAEELRAPMIIQTTPGTLQYASPGIFAGMVARLARDMAVPVALHLDHGDSFQLAQRCVLEGFTSLMIDGSSLPLDDNIRLTRRVVDMARGLPVEAELGTVGGKEDTHDAKPQYTDPKQAARFVEGTGVESLAVAIGTAHGLYRGIPRLDIDLLCRIRQAVSIPLVLHGASGVPREQVRACINGGVCKVNYATELRIAFSDGVKQALREYPDAFDPKKYLGAGRRAVKERAAGLIRLCGSDAKA